MSFLRQIFPTQPNKKHAIAMLLILKLLQPRNRAICLGQPSNCTLKNRHKRHVENNLNTSFVTNPCDSFFQPCLALTVSRIPSPNFCCEASGSCQCLMSDSMKNVHTLPQCDNVADGPTRLIQNCRNIWRAAIRVPIRCQIQRKFLQKILQKLSMIQ